MTKLLKLLVIPLIISFALISCNTTSPNKVKKSDAQKVTNIEYGTIKTSLPVKIEGESDWIGATAGAMIGGLLASQICGEEEILGTKCQDIAIVYGTIKTSLPVKIEGENDWIGATAGAMIGGLLASQICGEEEILGTKCQDIARVYGTIGGAAMGSVIQAKIGNHDGFQYIVNIDECGNDISNCQNDQEKAFVQGDDNALPNGQRVVIIYGDVIRVMPYEE